MTSDSSASHCGNVHDRTEYNSDCTSYFESSGAESGNYGTEKWRFGATPAGLGGTSFQGIFVQGGGVSGAEGGIDGGGGAGGTGEHRGARFVLAGEGDDESAGEESSADDSSSDGIGESASVADITDCLDFVGEVSQVLRQMRSSS